jgi:hypothetical protein
VGWKVSTNLRLELVLGALEMAIWSRGTTDLKGLVDHSDPGFALVAVNNCAWFGWRWPIAMPSALVTRAVVGLALPSIDNPITRRDQASRTTAQ